ncbi:MAG: quinone-dependent dihydroorotate dehydrogenase [Candidatus Gracilibacteria bacterium]|jgi:dihydroorotate dehydrogenase
MKEFFISIRNKVSRFLYKSLARKIFFLIDPEKIHNWMLIFGQFLGSNPITRGITAFFFSYSNKKLEQTILGMHFKNPVGLAAGFDKNSRIIDIMKPTGFGFTEVGSITGEPCYGNPKPRLWRLIKSQGLLINYGLTNDGSEKISKRLAKKHFKIPVAISIAKTNCKEASTVEGGIADYVKAYKAFADIGNFSVINISCPNAHGGEPFTDPQKLEKLLAEITKIPTKKPIFIKIAPDLEDEMTDQIIEISQKYGVKGFICTNLTKNRSNSKILEKNLAAQGSISGKPIEDLANKMIAHVYKKTGGKSVIIGVGGISSAEDAYRKIKLGASLVQLITGMIYEGPQLISEINQGLVKLLKKDGFKNVSEAVGAGPAQYASFK